MISIDILFLVNATMILVRAGIILYMLPFFGDQNVPNQVRVLLGVALAFFSYQFVSPEIKLAEVPEIFETILLVVKELIFGLAIGFAAKMVFEGIVMAASFVGYQMGFGTANLLLPASDIQGNSFTSLHRIIVLLFFLSLNLHHIFIAGLVRSFSVLPLGQFVFHDGFMEHLLTLTSEIFVIAIKLAGPVLVALFFAMITMGLVARSVPQVNVFTMSFPVSFYVGLLTYLATMPYLADWMRGFYSEESMDFLRLVDSLGQ